MGNEIRYGHVEGPGKGREYAVAPDIYFHRMGGKFVRLRGGVATLCASGDGAVMGWAVTPKDTTAKKSWKSDSTKGKDKIFVIYGLDDVYELPCDESVASLKNANATYLGQGAGIVNDESTNATYARVQKAKIGGNITASQLTVVDYDVDNHTVRVKIKPSKKQAA